jgi:transcriptional regulator with XRE-family HTH domain
VGRPSLFDDLRAKRAVDAVRQGLSRTAVAAKTGVSRATLMDWLARGRDGEAPYADFLDRVREAEAEAEAAMVAAVRTAAVDPKHWMAAAWWLERSRPADWAKREPKQIDEAERAEAQEAPDVEVIRAVLSAAESRKAG